MTGVEALRRQGTDETCRFWHQSAGGENRPGEPIRIPFMTSCNARGTPEIAEWNKPESQTHAGDASECFGEQ